MTLLATFKHISSKNADYGAAEAYLTFEHDEFTMKPTLDENGRLIPREDYRISSLNCGGEDFAVACMRANLRYEKNQKREDVKSHHYIISFDPRDGTDNSLTVDRAQELGEQFCKEHFPGHQALICTHPDGHNHSYNLLDQVTEVWDSGKRITAYTYNPDGTVRSIKNGNSLYTEYAYDADKNLTMLKSVLGEETIVENHYRYDGNGNRTEKQQKHGITIYTYDRLNQLVEVNYPDRTETLFYDKAGNRTGRVAGGAEERYYYDKRNRLTAQEKNGVHTEFQYDAAGNLVKDDTAAYTYDAFNRNTRVETFDGNIQINHYDAEGLRHEMEENGKLVQFIFRETEVVAEETQEEKIRYIRAGELLASDAESARTYYHYASDEMGSITHVTAGADVLNRYEYDAWGNAEVCEEKVANRFRFNGQQYDPVSQQYYLRARFYNPVIARFTQEDTYRGDGLNLYAYCKNNPVYYVDPSGHICEKRANEIMGKLAEGKILSNSEGKKLAAYLRNKERRGGITDAERQVLGQVDRKKAAKGSKSGSATKTLYHYTNEKGMNGIIESKKLNPSLKANNPKDARHGDGQYLSDIQPNTQTPISLAKKFIRYPNKYKYTHYVEIDVTDLDVIQGREGVFVILNESPLDLTNRIISTGPVGMQ